MAVVVEVTLAGVSADKYDALRAEVGWLDTPPTGGICHVVWVEGNDLRGLDVCESENAFHAFGQERIGPAMAKLGIDAQLQATFRDAHEVYVPEAITLVD
jgi:hypothetical protein